MSVEMTETNLTTKALSTLSVPLSPSGGNQLQPPSSNRLSAPPPSSNDRDASPMGSQAPTLINIPITRTTSFTANTNIGQLEVAPTTPMVSITFLLLSGARRMLEFDPATTVRRVKELVWSGWSADWDPRPPAPAYIRLLHGGRILLDDDTLASLKFPQTTSPSSPTASPPSPTSAAATTTIVHLSIRPSNIPPSEPTDVRKSIRRAIARRSSQNVDVPVVTTTAAVAGAGGRSETIEEQTAGGCCCIIC